MPLSVCLSSTAFAAKTLLLSCVSPPPPFAAKTLPVLAALRHGRARPWPQALFEFSSKRAGLCRSGSTRSWFSLPVSSFCPPGHFPRAPPGASPRASPRAYPRPPRPHPPPLAPPLPAATTRRQICDSAAYAGPRLINVGSWRRPASAAGLPLRSANGYPGTRPASAPDPQGLWAGPRGDASSVLRAVGGGRPQPHAHLHRRSMSSSLLDSVVMHEERRQSEWEWEGGQARHTFFTSCAANVARFGKAGFARLKPRTARARRGPRSPTASTASPRPRPTRAAAAARWPPPRSAGRAGARTGPAVGAGRVRQAVRPTTAGCGGEGPHVRAEGASSML